jgi:hypothetical protein
MGMEISWGCLRRSSIGSLKNETARCDALGGPSIRNSNVDAQRAKCTFSSSSSAEAERIIMF